MRLLFLTVSRITDVATRGIYTDLMRKFRDEGHDVYIISPAERRFGERTSLVKQHGITLLRLRTLNIRKTSVVEKGLATLLIEPQYLLAVKRYFSELDFDLVLYSTPPITLTNVVRHIKSKHGAQSYLLLKDIFPQNAVDMGMIRKNGLLHRYFRRKEKLLYDVSDGIGCMSPANVTYLHQHNPQINPSIIHLNPNSIDPIEKGLSEKERCFIKKKARHSKRCDCIPLRRKPWQTPEHKLRGQGTGVKLLEKGRFLCGGRLRHRVS